MIRWSVLINTVEYMLAAQHFSSCNATLNPRGLFLCLFTFFPYTVLTKMLYIIYSMGLEFLQADCTVNYRKEAHVPWALLGR